MVYIYGYEGKYSVTKKGEVWSHVRNIFLKQDLRGNYYAVKLGKFGKKLSVHRIVATAFIPNPFNKPEVNHKDGDKFNNKSSNLEWSTRKENIEHAQMNGLQKVRTYPVHRRQKISDKNAKKICELYKSGFSVIFLSEKYGVIRGTVYAILRKNKIERRRYVL